VFGVDLPVGGSQRDKVRVCAATERVEYLSKKQTPSGEKGAPPSKNERLIKNSGHTQKQRWRG
jgi:hypothetical protein